MSFTCEKITHAAEIPCHKTWMKKKNSMFSLETHSHNSMVFMTDQTILWKPSPLCKNGQHIRVDPGVAH